ncbi:hypothetical protein DNK47_02290 [Mycoplasma wenyonii]|uniref:Uncharacterized protein n=1 Tax=Mycoplasma wenyonii TaxID=65123 RepID=A0A328PT94_9MOLU|nr:hypothetical protein [Mycoplasma wenyonii]RAO94950.1 hypothetical protein DNK47_02290 [Mycoplasma wenyonii]
MGSAIAGPIILPQLISSRVKDNKKIAKAWEYDKNCKVLTFMTKSSSDDSEDINAQLLVCKTIDSSSDFNFFVYKNQVDNQGLREVKSFDFSQSNSIKITVKYANKGTEQTNEESEEFSVGTKANLDKLHQVELKTKCSVRWSDNRLDCLSNGRESPKEEHTLQSLSLLWETE